MKKIGIGLGLGNGGNGNTLPPGSFITVEGKTFITSTGKILVVAGA